jgi:hypothetical protein
MATSTMASTIFSGFLTGAVWRCQGRESSPFAEGIRRGVEPGRPAALAPRRGDGVDLLERGL